MNNIYKIKSLLICLAVLSLLSCKKFIAVDAPRTSLITSTVFINDATANAAALGLYGQLISIGFASGGEPGSVSFMSSLSSDELFNTNTGSAGLEYGQFNRNSIVPTSVRVLGLWSQPYQAIYKSNAIIEGLTKSSGITASLKDQLLGEAKFIRAFCHFYLVNLWGDVPLVTQTDYQTNAIITRTPAEQVYQQIINDLKDAQSLLATGYSFSNSERIRVNKAAATALLARVYLYKEDWVNAELQSTGVIGNVSQYALVTDLNNVFLKNSIETIWQMARYNANTWEATLYSSNAIPRNGSLTSPFMQSFEVNDGRRISWIKTTTSGGTTYYQPFKYKVTTSSPISEYSMVLRLAEQYLIRAEARAKQGKISGANSAATDLNSIRNRAGLSNTTANTLAAMLAAIEQERKIELFTEWGHRWLDLKRTNRANTVLAPMKPEWTPTDALYPIPQSQILNDPGMSNAQNPGY